VRHLTDRGALAALARGVPIEQMLTVALVPDQGTITWLSASPSRRAVTLRVHRVWDDGSDEFCDVNEFRAVEEDDYLGEGRAVGIYADGASALAAANDLGAAPDRWVNQGVIDLEYSDLRTPRSPTTASAHRPDRADRGMCRR